MNKKYTIHTINGLVEVENPKIVLDTNVYRDSKTEDNYLRFVMDIEKNDIIDIPRKNILYVRSIEI